MSWSRIVQIWLDSFFHGFLNLILMIYCALLDVNWKNFDRETNSLFIILSFWMRRFCAVILFFNESSLLETFCKKFLQLTEFGLYCDGHFTSLKLDSLQKLENLKIFRELRPGVTKSQNLGILSSKLAHFVSKRQNRIPSHEMKIFKQFISLRKLHVVIQWN